VDIDTALRELGPVDVAPLRDAILSQDHDAWLEQSQRQDSYEVHRYTESIVLVFTDGSGWPDIEVRKEVGWDRLAEHALPLMHDIIDRWYPKGGTIIRAMAAKLLVGGRISPHRDTHPSFHQGHRIHVPITTNPRVRLHVDGRPYRLQVGRAYEINNQKNHSVYNKGNEDRITFIFDYVPPQVIKRA
jgi:quercetin dioxygenase-like cupin family protein